MFIKIVQKFSVIIFFLLTSVINQVAADELSFTTPEKAGLSAERLNRIDVVMQEEIDKGNKAGIGVLIARHGKITYFKTHGYANLEDKSPLENNAYYRLYSMTKPITSVALLMLYEQGKFQLTDPLEKYVPAFSKVKVYAGVDDKGEMILEKPKRKIRIQDVFRHTAGFSYGLFNDKSVVGQAYDKAGIDYPVLDSIQQLVEEKLPSVPLLYHPGERWFYSYSHDVQAYLVEYFSGMSYAEYLQKYILDPLEMNNTFFGIPSQRTSRYTTVYSPDKEGKLQVKGKPEDDDYRHYNQHPFGGVGLSATMQDYARFAQMLLNGGELDGVRLLGKKTVEYMTTNHLPSNIPHIMTPGVGYGLGVSVTIDPVVNGKLGSVGEFGWGGYATTLVSINPKEDMLLLIFSQHIPFDAKMLNRFQTLIYQALIN